MSHDDARRQMTSGIPLEVICATCPWDRYCVQPPRMSREEVDHKIAEAEQQDLASDPQRQRLPVGMLMTTLAYAGQDTRGALCPVFAARLRQDRRVADTIRETMRNWNETTNTTIEVPR